MCAQWLHYLALKLLHSKRLRAPAASRKSVAPTALPAFSERDCYECLKEIEALLAQCLAAAVKPPQAARKGRRKTQAPAKVGGGKAELAGPKSARELMQLAVERGWVM